MLTELLPVTCVAVTLLAVYLSTAEGKRSDGDLRKSAKDAIKTGEKTLDDHKKELKQFKDKGNYCSLSI